MLWVALIANAGMFLVEAGASWKADSTALMADAVDFPRDAANYGVSLLALAAGALWRSRVALAKGWVMGAYGITVLLAARHNVGQARKELAAQRATILDSAERTHPITDN